MKKFPDIKNKVFNEDCLEGMKKIRNESVDLIITDPPFNIGKNYKGPYSDNKTSKNYFEWCKKWLTEFIRILKKKGALYLFNYPKNNAYLIPFLDKKLYFKRWMTWHYPTNTGHSPYNFTRSQHSILFYTKSKKPSDCIFNKNTIAVPYKNPNDKRIKERIKNGSNGRTPYDVFKKGYHGEDLIEKNLVKNVSKEKTKHICQLPVSLVEIFVKASSNKGDLVFDPFMGSGTTAIAALKNNRRYSGFEISTEYYKIIQKRVKEYQSKLTQF